MQQAFDHLLQLGYPKLTEFLKERGPISIEDRYDPEPWPALIRVVVGQQVSTHAAHAIWTKLENAASREFDRLFLDHPADLQGCGLSRAKVRTITELLQARRDGRLDLSALSNVPHEQRLAELTPYWGIGPWSVEMWSLFHCKDPDIWSPGDLALRKGAAGFAENQDPLNLVEKAAPYRSYLALYCWQAANANLFG